jgi:hypothetical protein
MIPVKKPWNNVVMGEGQPEYIPLPAHKTPGGEVMSAWELTDEELEHVKKHKTIMLCVSTYNQPVQPVKLWVTDENEQPLIDPRTTTLSAG